MTSDNQGYGLFTSLQLRVAESKISTWAGGRVTNFGPRRREDNDPARGGAEGGIIVLPTPRAEICLPPDSPCRKQIPDWLAPIFSIKKRKKIWRTPFRPDASGVYSSPARCIGHVFVTCPMQRAEIRVPPGKSKQTCHFTKKCTFLF